MAASSLSNKSLLKLPGAEKKPEPSGYAHIETGETLTTLTSKQAGQLIGKGKSVVLDFTPAHFQLEEDSFFRFFKDTVVSIDISSNCLSSLQHVGHFSKLKRLVCDNNLLTTICIKGLVSLEYLSLEGNQLTSVFDMSDCKKLVNLNLARNRIATGWELLAGPKSLRVLDLSSNAIDISSQAMEQHFFPAVKQLTKLEYLAVDDNPMCKKIPQLRSFVIFHLPKLKYLDWQAIIKPELKTAQIHAESAPWHQKASSRKDVIRSHRSSQALSAPSLDAAATPPPPSPSPPLPTATAPEPVVVAAAAVAPEESPSAVVAAPLPKAVDPLEAFLSGDDSALLNFISPTDAEPKRPQLQRNDTQASLDALLGSLEVSAAASTTTTTASVATDSSIFDSIDALLAGATEPSLVPPAPSAVERQQVTAPADKQASPSVSFDELLRDLPELSNLMPSTSNTQLAAGNAANFDDIDMAIDQLLAPPAAAAAAPAAQASQAPHVPDLDLLEATISSFLVDTKKPPAAAPPPAVAASQASHFDELEQAISSFQATKQTTAAPAPAPAPVSALDELELAISSFAGGAPASKPAAVSKPAVERPVGGLDELEMAINTFTSQPKAAPAAAAVAAKPADNMFDELESAIAQLIPAQSAPAPANKGVPTVGGFEAELLAAQEEKRRAEAEQKAREHLLRAESEFSQAQADARHLRDLAASEASAIRLKAQAEAEAEARRVREQAEAEKARILAEAEEHRRQQEAIARREAEQERLRLEEEKRKIEQERARLHAEAMRAEAERLRKEEERMVQERERQRREQEEKLAAAERAHQEEMAKRAREHEEALAAAAERRRLLAEAELQRQEAERKAAEAERRLQGVTRMKSLEEEREQKEAERLERDRQERLAWEARRAAAASAAAVSSSSTGVLPLVAVPAATAEAASLDVVLGQAASSGQLNFANVWEIKHTELQPTVRLGGGVYGVVWQGLWRGQQVTIKKFKCQRLDKPFLDAVRAEVPRLIPLRHANLVTFLGVCLDVELSAVYQYVNGVPLGAFLRNPGNTLDTENAIRIAREIAQAVRYLHSHGVVHRNLKSSNVLLNADMRPLLRDYGLDSVRVETLRSGTIGTPEYCAPEVLSGRPEDAHTAAVDVFSFGMLLWEIFSREQIFPQQVPVERQDFILRGIRPIVPLYPKCPTVVQRLIEAAWQNDPQARPSMEKLELILATPVDQILKYDVGAASSSSAEPTAAAAPAAAAPAKREVPADAHVHGVVARIVELLECPEAARQAQALKALINVGKVPGNVASVLKSPLIEKVVSLLPAADLAVSENACLALEAVCTGPSLAERIVQAQGLPPLIALLSNAQPVLQLAAAKALYAVASQDKSAVAVVRSLRGVPALVRLLQSPNAAVQTQGAASLCAFLDDADCQEEVKTANGVEILLHLLQNPNPGLQFRALSCLGLMMANPSIYPILAQYRLVDRFVHLLKVDSKLLRAQVAKFMAQFAVQHSLRGDMQIAGALPAIATILLQPGQDPHIAGVLLDTLSEFARDAAQREELRTSDALRALIGLMSNAEQPALQARAADVIADALTVSAANKQYFRASGGIATTVGLVTSSNPELVQVAVLLLSQLLDEPASLNDISLAGVAPYPKIIAEQGNPDSHLLQHVCHILAKISVDPKNQEGLLHTKTIAHLVLIASRSTNSLTCEYALEAISNTSSSPSAPKVIASYGLNFAAPYMAVANAKIVQTTLSLLANLAADQTTHPRLAVPSVLTALAPLLQHADVGIQSQAIKVSLLLARNHAENKAALTASPLVPVLQQVQATSTVPQFKVAAEQILKFLDLA